jgi:hypothetical protein
MSSTGGAGAAPTATGIATAPRVVPLRAAVARRVRSDVGSRRAVPRRMRAKPQAEAVRCTTTTTTSQARADTATIEAIAATASRGSRPEDHRAHSPGSSGGRPRDSPSDHDHAIAATAPMVPRSKQPLAIHRCRRSRPLDRRDIDTEGLGLVMGSPPEV